MAQPPKLLDKVRELLRLEHYSPKTEESYLNWIRRYLRFHNLKHPREMGTVEVAQFLSHLAVQEKVAALTQNQALSALLFLYREVLDIALDERLRVICAEKPELLPTVLSKAEVSALLARMSGMTGLMARLLYGVTPFHGSAHWTNQTSSSGRKRFAKGRARSGKLGGHC